MILRFYDIDQIVVHKSSLTWVTSLTFTVSHMNPRKPPQKCFDTQVELKAICRTTNILWCEQNYHNILTLSTSSGSFTTPLPQQRPRKPPIKKWSGSVTEDGRDGQQENAKLRQVGQGRLLLRDQPKWGFHQKNHGFDQSNIGIFHQLEIRIRPGPVVGIFDHQVYDCHWIDWREILMERSW